MSDSGKRRRADSERQSAEQLGAVLGSSPELISRVLDALDYRQLFRCARVCKSWRRYAERTAGGRRTVLDVWTVKDNAKSERACLKWTSVCSTPDVDRAITSVYSSPTHALAFYELPLSRPVSGGHDLLELQRRLPPGCELLGASGAGTMAAGGALFTRADARARKECMRLIALPPVAAQALGLSMFTMSYEQFMQRGFQEGQVASWSQLADMFGLHGSPRCLLLVAANYAPIGVLQSVAATFKRTAPAGADFALAGGLAKLVTYAPPAASLLEQPALVGLYMGGAGCTALSAVLGRRCKTEEAVASRITELSAQLTVAKRRLCAGAHRSRWRHLLLVFMCTERHRRHALVSREMALIEATLRTDHGHNMHVAGMLSLGECGHDVPAVHGHHGDNGHDDESDEGGDDDDHLVNDQGNFVFQLSTVVCCVAYLC